jgi:hypothetical protein
MAGAAAMILVGIGTPVQGHPAEGLMRAPEIIHVLAGKVCTSRVGATFGFGRDGHYTYDGLWRDHGHYSVHDGGVTILLDSGLEKDFLVSRRGGVLYMEETAVACA